MQCMHSMASTLANLPDSGEKNIEFSTHDDPVKSKNKALYIVGPIQLMIKIANKAPILCGKCLKFCWRPSGDYSEPGCRPDSSFSRPVLGMPFLFAGLIELFKIRTVIREQGSQTKINKLEKLMVKIGIFSPPRPTSQGEA